MDEEKPVAVVDTVDDDQEWASATTDFAAEHGVKVESDEKTDEEASDEAVKPPVTDEEEKADEDTTTEEEAPVEKSSEDADRARELRESRSSQREILAEEKAMQEDIRKELYPDLQEKLTDADGDPIESIEDVQKLLNPNTGENFTEEEAAKYLLQASKHLAEKQREAEQRVAEVAEVNLSIKDEADVILEKYGDFLSKPENHTLRDEILQDYFATLVKDPNTDIIIANPISMVRFYDRALKPYVEATAKISDAEAQAQVKADEAAKLAAENAKLKTRSDREDIFTGGGDRDVLGAEDKEWADATKEYYGKR